MARKNATVKAEPNTPAVDAPKVVLRTYRESDYEQVNYLYRNTQVPLVYESIRSKLWAPATWFVWFVGYSVILLAIPKVVGLVGEIPEWAMTTLRLIATFSWAVVGICLLFITSDRIELQARVDEAFANDLSDPDLYYLNYMIKDDKKVRKPEHQQDPSHFWVLTLDDQVCGMIGILCNKNDIPDRRTSIPVGWKQLLVSFLELARLGTPAFLMKERKVEGLVFAPKQKPKSATIMRWAVRSDLQTCGFSTLLMNRALSWANEHKIERVYAATDECCMAAEQIMVKRHGFFIMTRFNLNFFGEYKKIFVCSVQQWMETNGEKTKKAFKKTK